jgi:hypothetical protein
LKYENIDGIMLKQAFIGATNFLDKNKEEVNTLNVFPVPDGDTGTNMSLTMKASVKQILDLKEDSAGKIAMAASQGSLMGARGNSGVILSQLFRGFASGLKDKEKFNTKDLARAFKLASDTAYKAVMKPTEGTILTVARGCADYALSICEKEKDIALFMEKVVEEGNKVLNRTPEMLPVLKQAGVVDAGGKGLMYVLVGALNGITGKDDFKLEDYKEKQVIAKPLVQDIDTSDIKYGYCTEFMINTDNQEIDRFREQMAAFGDSLLVVGGEGLIKVHVHTNNPGQVLEKALLLGELNDIKIDNMRYQHRHIVANDEDFKNEKKEGPKKKYGIITVSIGEGLDTVFKELNVDYIISGGQTMNPSTEDILNAIAEVDGENIIMLPNNGNIVLAAEQAKELSDKNVYVFPTKTIPEGVSALLSFDVNLDVRENLKNMEEAISYVKTAQVTYAVRDTEYNDIKIKKDNIIGIQKDDIISVGDNIEDVSFELVKNLVGEDSSLITMFYGEDIKEEEAMKLSRRIEEEFEDYDIEVVFGGQPIYYYIFSIE